VRSLVVGRKALEDGAGALTFQNFDNFSVSLQIATCVKFRNGFDDRFHLGEDQSGLKFIICGTVDFTTRLGFRTEQVRQRQAGKQSGFAIAAWFALDRDPNLPPAIRRHATIDCFDEFALAGQQLHFLASENAFL
jgi:hypothetical protein